MPAATIRLRPACPDLEEGRIHARHLDSAADGFFRLMLGRRAEHILTAAYLVPGHDLSWQHVTLAEDDETIVGSVCGFTAAEHRRSTLQPLKDAAGPARLRLALVSYLFAPLLRIIDTIDEGDYYLQAIAVDDAARGAGVGGRLMAHIESRAREAGARRLVLDVSARNVGARRLYERCGMHIASQWPRRLWIPGLRLFRMVKAL